MMVMIATKQLIINIHETTIAICMTNRESVMIRLRRIDIIM